MIAYEDLVSALAAWRARNGLPVGAADYLGEPPPPEPVSFAAYESRPEHDLQLVVSDAEDGVEPPEPIEEPAPIEQPASDELAGGDYAMDGEWPVGEVDVAEEAILAEEAVRADSDDAAVAAVVEDDSYGVAVDSYDEAAHAYTAAEGDSIDELAAAGAAIDEALADDQPTLPPDEPDLAAAIDAHLDGDEPAIEAESLEAEVDLSDFEIPEEPGDDATVVGASPAPDDGRPLDELAAPAPAADPDEPL